MDLKSVTRRTSQDASGWLNLEAEVNMQLMSSARPTSHAPSGWLKLEAWSNMQPAPSFLSMAMGSPSASDRARSAPLLLFIVHAARRTETGTA